MTYCDEPVCEQIRLHGCSAYPEECCGVLLGSAEPDGSRRITGLVPIENRHADSKRNRFLIEPRELLQAEKHARQQRLELLGFYHSHPDAEANPSAFDLEHAWPWYLYVIVSVRGRVAAEPGAEPRAVEQAESASVSGYAARAEVFSQDLTCWQLSDDRSRFLPVELVRRDPIHV